MIIGLGDVLRQIRFSESERLLDMANKLEVSPAFLSALEHGKKNPPSNFLEKLENNYKISSTFKKRLVNELDRARNGTYIKSKSPLGRETAAVFARKVDTLSDEKLLEIQSLLKREKKA